MSGGGARRSILVLWECRDTPLWQIAGSSVEGFMRALGKLCAVAALVGVACSGGSTQAPARDYNWTGLYLGGHVGGTTSDVSGVFFDGISSQRFSQSADGLTAGAHVGGLYQINALVLGVEVSWAALDHKATSAMFFDQSMTTHIDDLLMVTARFGLAVDRWLPYVKAGYASSDTSFSTFITSTGVSATQSSGREHGYTLGLGAEYALASNILLGIQYDYVRLNVEGRGQSVAVGFPTPQTISEASADIHSVTARMSYKFGGETDRYAPMK
jgi:outer membrane immunogenic protein